jgi:hypothetical protein
MLMIRSSQQLADHSVDDLADPGESGNPAPAAAQRKLTSRGSPESKQW